MSRTRRFLIPVSFSASSVLQLSGAFAAFLAGYVLPLTFPELGESTGTILNVLGGILLFTGIVNLLFGRQFAKLVEYVGMRSRVLLPREGLVYLGVMLMLAVGALLGHSNMLLLVFGMMAGPFVLNGWVVILMLHRVSVERCLPMSAVDGEVFSVQLTLRNDKSMISSRLVELRDVVEGGRMRQEAEVTFVRVPPRSARSGSYQLRICGRGVYRFGPIRVSSRFPLGIGERGTTFNERAELYVHPAIGRLLPEWLRREQELSESTNRQRARVGVFDDDFHRVREFRAGDNPRSVHWRSSARHGQLMVKEYEQRREADLTVLLDLFQTTEFSEMEAELAVSLAATLCAQQTQRAASGHYRLIIAGRDFQDICSSGAARFRELALNALAVCVPSAKADLKRMLNELAGSAVSVSERFVMITPRMAEARRYLKMISFEQDPRLAGLSNRMSCVTASRNELLKVFLPPENLVTDESVMAS
ncbi:MAG: DUF58 domain-containing protein, partial [Planctomycetaceae bacterium]|nr:DUF58 domain-containing protein [Planctomycetaceae bacterium]